jgi:hypothetical protein
MCFGRQNIRRTKGSTMVAKNFIRQIGLAIASLVVLNASAEAQVLSGSSPVTDVDGYAGREMRSLYREGIGQGYSAESLNQIALRNARAHVPSFGTSGIGSSRVGMASPASLSKPFTQISPQPTVSPYMNLFRDDFSGESDLNYQTLVRPMLQQQQFNQQIQQQSTEISRRLQSISAQTNFNPQGSTTQPPTGHPTVFMYYGHFYPQAAQRRR